MDSKTKFCFRLLVSPHTTQSNLLLFWKRETSNQQMPQQIEGLFMNVILPLFGENFLENLTLQYSTENKFFPNLHGGPRTVVTHSLELTHSSLKGPLCIELVSNTIVFPDYYRSKKIGGVNIRLPFNRITSHNEDYAACLIEALREWSRDSEEYRKLLPHSTNEVAQFFQARNLITYGTALAPGNEWLEFTGVVDFASLKPGETYYHPVHGKLKSVEISPENGGTLRVQIGPGLFQLYEKLSHEKFALAESPASKELTRQRALAFAPYKNTALLFFLDAAMTDKGDKFRMLPETVYSPGKTILATFNNGRTILRDRGVRNIPADDLRELSKEILELAVNLYQKYGIDLLRMSVFNHLLRRNKLLFPSLGMTKSEWSQKTIPLAAELLGLSHDVSDTHFVQLFMLGIHAFIDGSFELPPETQRILSEKQTKENELGRGPDLILAPYYTESHSLHDADPFTKVMRNLEATESQKDAKILFDYAATSQQFSELQAKSFDFVTFVPGSTKGDARNRAYYLAREIAWRWNFKMVENGVFNISPEWSGRSQKLTSGILGRLENATDKFSSAEQTTVKGKRILLIEDVNTAGVTLELLRYLLYAKGAKKVFVVSFAQSVSGEYPAPKGLTSNPNFFQK